LQSPLLLLLKSFGRHPERSEGSRRSLLNRDSSDLSANTFHASDLPTPSHLHHLKNGHLDRSDSRSIVSRAAERKQTY
jgi:hypothetical protein